MKTGSFVLPRLLSQEAVREVAGGVSPNFNYQQPPQNYANINLTANGGSGSQITYQVNTNLAVSNVTITGSVTGNTAQLIAGASITVGTIF